MPDRPVASWACGANPVPRVSFQEGTPGQFPCKQQRICKALSRIGSPARRNRTVLQMEWTARGGPSVFGFHIRRDRARHAAPRDANARRDERRAQFQLCIFSYQILRSLANLMLSRLNLGVALALIALEDALPAENLTLNSRRSAGCARMHPAAPSWRWRRRCGRPGRDRRPSPAPPRRPRPPGAR